MEVQELYNDTKEFMLKSLNALKKDYMSLRTGKVSTKLLDNINISYYGNQSPINQVASVLAIDANTISITPWEKNILADLEKAIIEANLNVNPNNDGECIKLFFPPMSKEHREENVKKASLMTENSKVSIRNIRRDANDKIKEAEKNKELSLDESKLSLKEIQKITDEFIKKTEEIFKNKKEEILKI